MRPVALHHHPHRRTALGVPYVENRPPGVGGIRLAPLPQGHENRPQIAALARQPVLVPGPAPRLLVGHGRQDADRDQLAEPVGEHRVREPDMAPEVVETPDPDERVPQDQQRPLLADEIECALDRAVLRAHVEPFHATTLATWLCH